MKQTMVSLLHFPESLLCLAGIISHAYLASDTIAIALPLTLFTSIRCIESLNVFNKTSIKFTTISSRLVTGCSTSSYCVSSCYGRYDVKLIPVHGPRHGHFWHLMHTKVSLSDVL